MGGFKEKTIAENESEEAEIIDPLRKLHDEQVVEIMKEWKVNRVDDVTMGRVRCEALLRVLPVYVQHEMSKAKEQRDAGNKGSSDKGNTGRNS